MIEMWELLLKSRKAMFGLVVLIVFILLGTVAPLLVGDPYAMNLNLMGRPPSLQHILGTTSFGEDVFAQEGSGSDTQEQYQPPGIPYRGS